MDYTEYFDFGACNEQGLHYALWEPVLDRFLLVLSDFNHCETIKFLASSRYKLFLIDLTTAENYTPTLIDNECCENWTLSNRGDISIIHPSQYVDAMPAKKLLPNTADPHWDLVQEKTWLQYVLIWLKFIDRLKQTHTWMHYDYFIDRIHAESDLPGQGQGWYDRMRHLENHILKTLYLGHDPETTQDQIVSLLKQDDYVFDFWQRHMR